MQQTITMMLGVIGLLALILVGRGFITGLGADTGMDFSLRQSRTERGPAPAPLFSERSHSLTTTEASCQPPAASTLKDLP